jgi:hypothetical protein
MRVAILYSGFANFFDIGIPSLYKYLGADKFDAFVHLYDKVGASTAKVASSASEVSFDVVKDEFISLVKPKAFVIEPSEKSLSFQFEAAELKRRMIKKRECSIIGFDDMHSNYCHGNTLSMLYGWEQVWKLKEDYSIKNNIKYDIVIRARMDFVMEDYLELDGNLNKCSVSNVGKFHGGLNDQFAYGSEAVMEKYFLLNQHVRDYLLNDGITYYPELILKHHFVAQNILANEIDIKYYLQRPGKVRMYLTEAGAEMVECT